MEYLVIFIVIMVVLGIIAAVGQANDKRKMQDLLDGKPMQISVPSVVEDMPIDEWRGLVGRGRYEYFAARCKSANKPIYEALLALQIRHDEATRKEEALLAEIESARTEAEGKIDDPASFVKLHEKIQQRYTELTPMRDLADSLMNEMHRLESTVDHSLDIRTETVRKAVHLNQAEKEAFAASETLLGSDGRTGIAIDQENKRIAILTPFSRTTIGYDQIVSSEVCVDSKSLIKSQLGSLVFRSAIGGLLTGGVGAVIGGVTGKKESIKDIKSVELKVLVKGTSTPIHTVKMYEKGNFGVPEAAINKAGHWHDLLTVAIDEAHSKFTSATALAAAMPAAQSLTDQLQALSKMQQDGILSEEEFAAAKAKILS